MNHSSNDVKVRSICFKLAIMFGLQVLVAQLCSHLAACQPALLPPDLLRPLLPTLLNGTMEKNSMVKACSETALVDLLQMRKGRDGLNEVVLFVRFSYYWMNCDEFL